MEERKNSLKTGLSVISRSYSALLRYAHYLNKRLKGVLSEILHGRPISFGDLVDDWENLKTILQTLTKCEENMKELEASHYQRVTRLRRLNEGGQTDLKVYPLYLRRKQRNDALIDTMVIVHKRALTFLETAEQACLPGVSVDSKGNVWDVGWSDAANRHSQFLKLLTREKTCWRLAEDMRVSIYRYTGYNLH